MSVFQDEFEKDKKPEFKMATAPSPPQRFRRPTVLEDDIAKHFALLFRAGLDDGEFIATFDVSEKKKYPPRQRFHPTVEDAAAAAISLANRFSARGLSPSDAEHHKFWEPERHVATAVASFGSDQNCQEGNVSRVFGLCVDHDSQPEFSRAILRNAGLEPTIATRSGGLTKNNEEKGHDYYVLTVPERDIDACKRVSRRLIKYCCSGDSSVASPVHPLRVPGGIHKKGKDRQSYIVATSERYWTLAEIDQLLDGAGVPREDDRNTSSGSRGPRHSSDAAWDHIDVILDGSGDIQPAMARLAMLRAHRGDPAHEIEAELENILERAPFDQERLRRHLRDVPRTVASAIKKVKESEAFQKTQARRDRIASLRNPEHLALAKAELRPVIAGLAARAIRPTVSMLLEEGLFERIGTTLPAAHEIAEYTQRLSEITHHKPKSDIRRLIAEAAEAARTELASANAPAPSEDDDLPEIDLSQGGDRATNAIYDAFRQYNDTFVTPKIFSTYDALSMVAAGNGRNRLRNLNRAGLQGQADQVARFRSGGRSVHAPKETCEIILAAQDWPGDVFPPVEHVIESPCFGANWELIASPGYHPASRALHLGRQLDVGDIPEAPSPEEVQAAVELFFDDVFGDFPFKDVDAVEARSTSSTVNPVGRDRRRAFGRASRANLLALTLTPFVRTALDAAPIPPFLFAKPQERVGASLCATVAMMIANGYVVSASAVPTSAYEWQNKLLALVRERAGVFFIDNLKWKLDDGTLAGALTQGRVSGRALGANTNIEGLVTWITLITGINPELSPELTKRSVLIRLESDTANPESRTDFKHGDDEKLKDWILENRAKLVRAAIILVRNWLAKGGESYDVPDLPSLGSFGRWNRVMGGILHAAGVKGFRDNRENAEAIDVDADTELDVLHRLGECLWKRSGVTS